MKYPTPGDYQEALQFPETAFADPALRAAVPDVNALGLPQVVTGAFAAVFRLEGPSAYWAVKCFLAPVRDRQARYQAVARHLADAGLPFTVAFDYQPAGLHVLGQQLPLLKMRWVEGVSLNRFVARHLEHPDVLEALAEQWAALAAALEAAAMAHGDLQHGNVLVCEADGAVRLKLVDYDTTYVPALKGRKSVEVGHRNYQHPDRTEDDFGPYLDRFSALVIYVALRACIAQPSLWHRYDTGENLLFRAADFFDPGQSPLLEDLAQIDALVPLAEALRTACFLEPETVPSLAAVREGGASVDQAGRRRARRRAPGASVRRRPERRSFEQLFLPVLLVCLAGSVVLAYAVGPAMAGIFLLLAGSAAGWSSYVHYGRLPWVRRARRLRREGAYFEQITAQMAQEVERLERAQETLYASLDALQAARLQALRDEVLQDRLKYHFVSEAIQFDGVTHKVVVRLKAAGIRNAYMATPERLAAVKSLGNESRGRVALWRAGLVLQYQEALPRALPPAEVQRLERQVQRRAASLHAERERRKEKIHVQRTEQRQLAARAEAIPAVSFGHYLLALLRMRSLPSDQDGPPRPQTTPPPGERPLHPAVPRRDEAPEPWWTQA